MIHAVPVMDFIGVMQVGTLEVGTIEVNAQPIPAVRFLLNQNQPYAILASGQHAAEIYAYCDTALEKRITEIDVKISCALIVDAQGNFHTNTSQITWFTTSKLRENASSKMQLIFEKGKRGKFKFSNGSFVKVSSKVL